MLPNEDSGVSMISSTSEITSANIENNRLEYLVSTPGKQVILWSKKKGHPAVKNAVNIESEIVEKENVYEIQIKVTGENSTVVLELEN